MTLQLGMLLAALAAFSAHDIATRTIPRWLCGLVALAITAGYLAGHLTVSLASAVLGAMIFWIADLPMGDRAAIFLSCSLMAPGAAALTSGLAVGAGLLYVYGIGRFRSMIGFPFFPAVALCAMVALWTTS